MLVLTREDVRRLIRVEEIIAAVEAAHRALGRGEASQAIDAATPLPGGGGVMLPMAAAIVDPAAAAVKVLADVPENRERRQHSTITVIDPASGRCVALLDGIEITLQRTAAASAVATRLLARDDARTLGLIGAGAQARSHLAALRTVRDIDRVVVWSRTRATAERFAAEHPDVEVAERPEDVVRAADVLCTLTPAREPYVHGAWFAPGLHVNAVGAPPRPDHREVDTEGICRSTVVVDDLAAALDRSGEVCVPIAEGAITAADLRGDLGQLLGGTRPGRTSEDEITLFDSVGLALQDVAAAHAVLAHARATGAGVEVDLHSDEG